MIKIAFTYFQFFLIALLVYSCALTRKETKNNIVIPGVTEKQKEVSTNLLIEGKKEEVKGNYTEAERIFKECIVRDPSAGACRYELANIYFLKKNYNSALTLINEAVKSEPKNIWYKLQLAKVLEEMNRLEETGKVYSELIKEYPERYDFYYYLAGIHLKNDNYKDAIKIYNELEKKIGINEDLSIQKKNIYLSVNKLDNAINEIQKLIEKFPSEIKYYNLKADIYLANSMPDKAYEIYKKIIEIDSENQYVHLSLAEYYRVKGDREKSFNELKIAFENPKLSIDSKITILLSYYIVTENFEQLRPQAYELTNLLIKAHPTEAKSYAMYGDFLVRDKNYKEARTQYEKVVSLDSSKYSVWEQLLFIESELKDYKSVLKRSYKAMELFPYQPMLYLINGDANFKLKNFEEAIKSLKKGAELSDDKDEMQLQFYSFLGDCYNEVKNFMLSDSIYELVLSIKPDNESVLNNYAYFLSLRGEKLDKAESMASRAVRLRPESASYLDTYGWVLYKQGKYTKAKVQIEKALEKLGGADNDIILEHYGDILYKTGHIEKAVEYWKKAKENGKGTELLDKKIAEEKLYE